MKEKKGIGLKTLILIVLFTSIVTSLTTGVIMYNNNRITSNVSGNDLSKDADLAEFLKVYASLVGDYYDDFDKKGMLEAGLNAMFQYLGEDYTDYLNKEETDSLAEKLAGEYRGIGIQIINNGVISKVFDDTPAKDVGLLEGDQIISVNGESIADKDTSFVSKMIQDSTDSVFLQVMRNQETLSFTIPVKTMFLPVVNKDIIESDGEKIGYLAISTFSSTVEAQVKNALKSLEEAGISSLVLDLRGNTGGYLSQATDIASMFLEKGKIIYSLAEKNETKEYRDESDEKRDYPIVVLMNEGTASASEILAAALKDSYGATLLGEVSYGKGKVQQTKNLDDGSMVKYTTARWIRPNGDCIDGVGLKPDIEVILDYDENSVNLVDIQLKEAIRVLKES